MANVATLTAKMVMDVSGFSSGANKAIGTLDHLKGGVGALSASMVAGAAGGIAMAAAMKTLDVAMAGVGATFRLVAGEMQHGFGLAMEAESAETSFAVLLHSAEKAKKLMGEINSFTLSTPFSTAGTMGATKALMGAGVAQENLMSTMRMLGEISGGNTETFGGLATVYGQVMAKGKLLSQDFNQVAERGINLRKVLATELHVGLADVSKMMEAGKVSSTDFHNALHRLATEDFAGSLEASSMTMKGAFDRLGEIRDSFDRDVMMGLSEKWGITSTANDLANFAEGLKSDVVPKVVNAFDAMSTAAFDLVDNMRAIQLLTPLGQMEATLKNPTANPFTRLRDDLAKINTKRDFNDALRGVRDAGAKSAANRAPLPESKRMEKSLFTDLGTNIGAGVANGLMGGLMKAGGSLGTVGMAGAHEMARKFLTPETGPEYKPTGALVAGSSDAFSAIIRSMTGADRNSDTKRTAVATEKALEKLDRMTKEIVDAVKGQISGIVSSFSG